MGTGEGAGTTTGRQTDGRMEKREGRGVERKVGEMSHNEEKRENYHREKVGRNGKDIWKGGQMDGCSKDDGQTDGSWMQGKPLAEMPRDPPGCGLPSGQTRSERALPSRPPAGGHRWQDGGREVLPGRGPPAAPGGGRGWGLDRRGPHHPRGAAHASVPDHHHPPGEAWGPGRGVGAEVGGTAGPRADPPPLPARTPPCSPALSG